MLEEYPGSLTSDSLIYEFPPIVTKNARGSPMSWQIKVKLLFNDMEVPITEEHLGQLPEGYLGAYWKTTVIKNISERKPTLVKKGKNLGTIRETNVLTQALADAHSEYKKYLRKNNPDLNIDGILLQHPMLAIKYIDSDLNLNQEPVMIQRKYNGTRGLATLNQNLTDVIIYSRDRIECKSGDHLKQEMKVICQALQNRLGYRVHLDGEVYKHGHRLEDISGQARRINNLETSNLIVDFMWYDFIVPDDLNIKFFDRFKLMIEIFNVNEFKFIKLTETIPLESPDQLDVVYQQFLTEGYEGAIIRRNGVYKPSVKRARSKDVIKMKPVSDDEFKIVDYTMGNKGIAAETLMYVCQTKSGERFNIVIGESNISSKGKNGMSYDRRKELYTLMSQVEDNGATYFENHIKDRMITISYHDLTETGIPMHAQTVGYLPRSELC